MIQNYSTPKKKKYSIQLCYIVALVDIWTQIPLLICVESVSVLAQNVSMDHDIKCLLTVTFHQIPLQSPLFIVKSHEIQIYYLYTVISHSKKHKTCYIYNIPINHLWHQVQENSWWHSTSTSLSLSLSLALSSLLSSPSSSILSLTLTWPFSLTSLTSIGWLYQLHPFVM